MAVALLAGACSASPGPASPGDPRTPAGSEVSDGTGRASLSRIACSLPHEWLLRAWRGYRPDRSGDIQVLPKEGNLFDAGLPHVGPWDYTQRVPMFWYGPGSADIAPTQAELLGYPFHALDGAPMREALVPAGRRPEPPRLIVTVVWDAGGRDVLDAWPRSWPYLSSLVPRGAWYEDATVGSSPTQTAQIHATIGTGAFPDHHGLTAHRMRVGGDMTTPWAAGPAYLLEPTLADIYDRAMGDRPVVGAVATLTIHLGMLGHGSLFGGGDRDVVALHEEEGAATLGAEGVGWNLPEAVRPYFRFPAYVNDVPGFGRDVRTLDARDGEVDGRWRGNDIAELNAGFDTPARIPYQTRVLEEVIRREGFGRDGVPDLLFVNYKVIDYVSHAWSMNSPEMRDTVAVQDAALRTLVRFLDRQVGEGRWALLLTADHGSTPPTRVSGGLVISSSAVEAGLERAFGDGDGVQVVEHLADTQIYLNTAELEANGHTLAEVSRWLLGLTEEQTAQVGVSVPPDRAGETVFQAAFPSAIMRGLPCLPEARS